MGTAVLLGAAVAIGGMAGCSQDSTDSNPRDSRIVGGTGTVGLLLNVGPGVGLKTANWVIRVGAGDAGAPVRQCDIPVVVSGTMSAQIGDVPSGTGYMLTLSGSTADGGATCIGSSLPFAVASGTTATVEVALNCTGQRSSGVILDAPFPCPVISSLKAVPMEVEVPGSMILSALVTTIDGDTLTPAWTGGTTIGHYGDPAAFSTTFTCDVPGTATIQVMALSSNPLFVAGCAPPVAAMQVTCTAGASSRARQRSAGALCLRPATWAVPVALQAARGQPG
jgi:hypothetical protein